jgi:hypothetical protein
MTPKWGAFPFCNAPIRDNAQRGQNLWPVGFTADQIMDLYYNWKTIDFNIEAVPDVTDERIRIEEASSVLNTGQLLALDMALDMATAGNANRSGVTGKLTRRTDSSQCTGVRFVHNKSLCYVELSFYPVIDSISKKVLPGVVRVARGNRYLYHPRLLMVFWASGYVFSNSAMALYGAGTCVGVVDFDGGSVPVGGGVDENDIYYAPAGTGNAAIYSNQGFNAVERLDEITFSPRGAQAGDALTVEGIDLGGVKSVWFGRLPASFSINNKVLTVTVPEGAAREPITMATDQDVFATREYFH